MDGRGTDREVAPARSRRPLAVAVSGLATVAVTVGLAWARAAAPGVALAELELSAVRREALVQRVSGPGRLVPKRVRWLTATQRARVEQVLVQAGDQVEAGTPIALLRNPEMDLALLEAERELAAARFAVAGTRRQLDTLASELGLSLAAAREQAEAARVDGERLSRLEQDGVASTSDRQKAASRERELFERLGLLERRSGALARARAAELEPGQALVSALEQVVAHRQRDLGELSLTSGAAGVVYSVVMEPGQWVEAGFVLGKVITSDELVAELSIDELDARGVSVGQAGAVHLGSLRLTGRVARIDPVAARGVVTVELSLDAAEPGMRADQRLSGEVEVKRYPEALSLKAPPQVTRAGHFSLYKRSGSRDLLAVDTELVPATDGRVLVRSGLSEGDEVVITDLSHLGPHERLSIH